MSIFSACQWSAPLLCWTCQHAREVMSSRSFCIFDFHIISCYNYLQSDYQSILGDIVVWLSTRKNLQELWRRLNAPYSLPKERREARGTIFVSRHRDPTAEFFCVQKTNGFFLRTLRIGSLVMNKPKSDPPTGHQPQNNHSSIKTATSARQKIRDIVKEKRRPAC